MLHGSLDSGDSHFLPEPPMVVVLVFLKASAESSLKYVDPFLKVRRLKVVGSFRIFWTKWSDTFRSFLYMEKSKNFEK